MSKKLATIGTMHFIHAQLYQASHFIPDFKRTIQMHFNILDLIPSQYRADPFGSMCFIAASPCDRWTLQIKLPRYLTTRSHQIHGWSQSLYRDLSRPCRFLCSGCLRRTAVTVPDSVTAIGDNVFDGCCGLQNAIMSKKLISVGNYEFYSCPGLSITLYPGLQRIYANPFQYSGPLFTNFPTSLTSISDYTFSKCSQLYCIFNLTQYVPS